VKVENDLLTIKGEKKNEVNKEDEKFTLREFNHTKFSRTFTLPESVDSSKVNAEYADGILKIMIPKKEEAKQKGRDRNQSCIRIGLWELWGHPYMDAFFIFIPS
jgi:HSP20 family protein